LDARKVTERPTGNYYVGSMGLNSWQACVWFHVLCTLKGMKDAKRMQHVYLRFSVMTWKEYHLGLRIAFVLCWGCYPTSLTKPSKISH
jgi:hypothetical protein